MRAKTIATFALGIATGMLGLAVLLWTSGTIPRPLPAWKQPMVPMPFNLNELTANAKAAPPAAEPLPPLIEPPPAVAAPPLILGPPAVTPRPPEGTPPAVLGPPVASPPPSPSGEANRLAPGAPVVNGPRLSPPLAGLDLKALHDSFADSRNGRRHEALDIPAPRGTPVLAVAEGNVAKLFTSKQGGTTVYQFDNSGTWCFYYAHLEHYAPGLKEGTLLRKGDVLGYVGVSGNASATAPHLHLAVFQLKADRKWWEGTPIDPLPLLR